jgi:hypothetical protein
VAILDGDWRLATFVSVTAASVLVDTLLDLNSERA